jgi:hypothetical protein
MGQTYQIRVELLGVRPVVWRRLLVSDATTLARLHIVIQDALGWSDYHLHEFEIRGVRYGDPRADDWEDSGVEDERTARLRKLGLKEGSRFGYLYDFGDGWRHSVRVERILPAGGAGRLPVCVGGARACPLEDVGGVGGYADFVEAITDEAHPEHEQHLTWAGGSYDPEAFDLKAANRRLRMGGLLRREARWDSPAGLEADGGAGFDAKEHNETAEDESAARVLPFRRDVVCLLEYIRDNRVTGTSTTGNLPLKAVAEIAARFVEPPPLERRIGEYVERYRSEEYVWPVYFARSVARGAGVVSGGPGRRWRLTAWGEVFLSASAFAQVLALLRGFCYRVDWATLTGASVFGDTIEPGLRRAVLSLVRELSFGQTLQSDAFTDRLIEEARLAWEEREGFDVRRAIRSAVQSMVVRPLAAFGVLTAETTEEPRVGAVRETPVSFSVTALGAALLKALA